ncbi:hypothetical protein NQ315_004770 [Exocentrus adspersus]|uniref:Uncharacterized protein n=1 Tax=Exocentrus adspersus TaxID=1586481 RepID=A0AAV8W3D8_9CUCU|nr:hypothetical protein NQ315_004770 [Exocentrus adspersus]
MKEHTLIFRHPRRKYFSAYKANQTGTNAVHCDFNSKLGPDKVCVASVEQLGKCNPDRLYGYNTASPCIFLKLNRIYGWEPQFYTSPVEGMPPDLTNHILNITEAERNQIWVSCHGLDEVDKENIKGFNYYPRGFAGYYYPYRNTPNYLSPVIAVEVLSVKPNVIVSIECRAWAGNIEYRGGSLNRAGSITFEVQVDAEVINNTCWPADMTWEPYRARQRVVTSHILRGKGELASATGIGGGAGGADGTVVDWDGSTKCGRSGGEGGCKDADGTGSGIGLEVGVGAGIISVDGFALPAKPTLFWGRGGRGTFLRRGPLGGTTYVIIGYFDHRKTQGLQITKSPALKSAHGKPISDIIISDDEGKATCTCYTFLLHNSKIARCVHMKIKNSVNIAPQVDCAT